MKTKPGIKSTTSEALKHIQFADVFNMEDIQSIQDLFADACGVASLITHPDGTPITKPSNFCRLCSDIIRKTEKGCSNCFKSDAVLGRHSPSGPVVQQCLSSGLWDAGASITVEGKHIANWLIGQVRNKELDEQRMLQYADEIGANKKDFMEALKEVPVMSVEQLNKVSKMLFAFANELSEKAYYNLQLKLQIAEQETATAAQQESEERYRLLIQASREGILVAQGVRLILINPMVLELTGYTYEELMSIPFLKIVHHDDRELVRNNYLKRLKGEAVGSRYHFRILKKDKSLKWIEISGVRIEWEGKPAVQVFVTDITDRIQAEAEIKLKNERLTELIVEKDKFFSIIAHDLRNPLISFLGLTQIMAEKLPSLTREKIQQLVVSMRNSASSLIGLLENLLHWAKIQQGLIPFNPKLIRLFPLIDESMTMVLEPAKIKEIAISYDIPDDLLVFADSNILQTIIRNLVSNALKFTPKGGKISLSAKVTEDNSALISIKDNGIGMNRAMVHDLFRFDVKTNRKGTEGEPSTGLGLLLCNEFIGKHGGELCVESEEGKGSTFYFTLPCNEVSDNGELEGKNIISQDGEERQINNLKILIAEDDETSEMLLTEIVNIYCKNVLHAVNGVEAVGVCQSNPDIDLILMDVKMPEMNGYEATRQIRLFNKDVVIIAQTAFGMIGDREKAIAAGCNDYISKPISLNLLTELLKKHFNVS